MTPDHAAAALCLVLFLAAVGYVASTGQWRRVYPVREER